MRLRPKNNILQIAENPMREHRFLRNLRKLILLRHLSYKTPSDLVKIGSCKDFVTQIIPFSELLCINGKF
jgi:hypothetical protein